MEKTIDNSPILNPKIEMPTNDLENKKTSIKNENTPKEIILIIISLVDLGFNDLFIIVQLSQII